jgi:hypothetical protein
MNSPNQPEPKKRVRGFSTRAHGTGPDALTEEAKSILAVLLLAQTWTARYLDGWVSVDDFAGVALGLGAGRDRPSLTAGIRNGLGAIRALGEGITIEDRPTHALDTVSKKRRREHDRRLADPISPTLQAWLLSNGDALLDPKTWAEFLRLEFHPVVTLGEIVAALEETVVRTLLGLGRHGQALERIEVALSNAKTSRERRSLELARATVLLRGARDADWVEAEDILNQLHDEPVSPIDHFDYVTDARIRISLAYIRFVMHIRGKEPATQMLHDDVEEIRGLLHHASQTVRDLSLGDRGQIANAEGLLFKWEAQVEKDESKKQELFARAEKHLRQGLTLWRAAHDSYSLGVSVYNLGELAYSRYQLNTGGGTEKQLREALAWYQASVGFTQAVGIVSEWVLDYVRAAECVALLIPHLVESENLDECRKMVEVAKSYLEAARLTELPFESKQVWLIRKVTNDLRRAIRAHSPPLAE